MAARRKVEVHVDERTLEGALLALLAVVAPNQLTDSENGFTLGCNG